MDPWLLIAILSAVIAATGVALAIRWHLTGPRPKPADPAPTLTWRCPTCGAHIDLPIRTITALIPDTTEAHHHILVAHQEEASD